MELEYFLPFLRYFFGTGPRPELRKKMLENERAFFSFVSRTSLFGYAHLIFSEYPELANTGLTAMLKERYERGLAEEAENLRNLEMLEGIAQKNAIPMAVLKEYDFKRMPFYRQGSRPSSDVDVLIRAEDLFRMDRALKEKSIGLNFINFGQWPLETREKENLWRTSSLKTSNDHFARTRELLRGLDSPLFNNFNYRRMDAEGTMGGLIEVHFSPNRKERTYRIAPLTSTALWNELETTESPFIFRMRPEMAILYDANHFLIHLTNLRAGEHHLKRLCDLAYRTLFNTIDWNLLVELARKNRKVTPLLFYLTLGKNHLNLPIPSEVLRELKERRDPFAEFVLRTMFDYRHFFSDRVTARVRIGARFLSQKSGTQNPGALFPPSPERHEVLRIVRKFFGTERATISTHKANNEKLLALISDTSMDGIAYDILSNEQPNSFLVRELRDRARAARESEDALRSAYVSLRHIPMKKIFLKDSTYRFTSPHYISGTRYAADIDVYTDPNNLPAFDRALADHGWRATTAELQITPDIYDLAYEVNRDITKYPELRDEIMAAIARAKECRYRDYATELIGVLSRLRARVTRRIELLRKNGSGEHVLRPWYIAVEHDAKLIEKYLLRQKTAQRHRRKRSYSLEGMRAVLIDYRASLLALSQEEELLSATIGNLNLRTDGIVRSALAPYQRLKDELIRFLDLTREDIERALNREVMARESAQTTRSLEYHHIGSGFADVHSSLSAPHHPFHLRLSSLAYEPIDKDNFVLKREDSIVLDACHFCSNLAKYPHPIRFHGFLKYLTDLLYKMKEDPLDWNRVVECARNANALPQVYFYLRLAQRHLNAPIPDEVIRKVKNGGSFVQNILLDRVDGMRILFNEPTFFSKLYAKAYLEPGRLHAFVTKAHNIYNQVQDHGI